MKGLRAEPLILADPEMLTAHGSREFMLYPGEFRMLNGKPDPHFTVDMVASVFFAVRPDSLRRRLKESQEFILIPDDSPFPECTHNDQIPTDRINAKGEMVWDTKWLFDENSVCTRCGGVDWGNKNRAASNNYRMFDLATIERMAHASADHGMLNGSELDVILKIVLLIARRHKYL